MNIIILAALAHAVQVHRAERRRLQQVNAEDTAAQDAVEGRVPWHRINISRFGAQA